MKVENGYIYGASRKEIVDMLVDIHDGAAAAALGIDVESAPLYELEQAYMSLTGSNCFN